MTVTISEMRKQGNAEQTDMRQGNVEIARQTVMGPERRWMVMQTYTRHARHKSHIMRGHEVALLLKRLTEA